MNNLTQLKFIKVVDSIVNEIPISYYVPNDPDITISCDYCETSSYDLITHEVTLSYNNIINNIHKLNNKDLVFQFTRALVFHELAHALLTPKDLFEMKNSIYSIYVSLDDQIVNIAEDARIEFILKDYFIDNDFSIFKKTLFEYHNPETIGQAFFNILRLNDYSFIKPKNEFEEKLLKALKNYVIQLYYTFCKTIDEPRTNYAYDILNILTILRYFIKDYNIPNKNNSLTGSNSNNNSINSTNNLKNNSNNDSKNLNNNSGTSTNHSNTSNNNSNSLSNDFKDNDYCYKYDYISHKFVATFDSFEEIDKALGESQKLQYAAHEVSTDSYITPYKNYEKMKGASKSDALNAIYKTIDYNNAEIKIDNSIFNLEQYIKQFVKKNQNYKSSSRNTYSGKIDYKSCDRKDYRYFKQLSNQQNDKLFNKINLNLFIDSSYSMSDNTLNINRLIASLKFLSDTIDYFTFNICSFCDRYDKTCIIDYKKGEKYRAHTGSGINVKVIELYKSFQQPRFKNFNILLADGFLMLKNGYDTKIFDIFNNKNSLLIVDESNKNYLNNITTAQKIIINENYCNRFINEIYKFIKVNIF